MLNQRANEERTVMKRSRGPNGERKVDRVLVATAGGGNESRK